MQNQTDAMARFSRMMAMVIAVAGLVWLGLSLYNTRQGGRFSWTGLTLFLVLLAAMWIVGARARRG